MFNYIKWELRDYFYSKYKLFLTIGIIFLLFLIYPINAFDSFFGILIMFGFSISLLISIVYSYYMGTKKAVSTFNKKTFLLESMIPLSAKKILLAKYILGIIVNLIYLLVTILGFVLVMIKSMGLIDTFEGLREIIENINLVTFLQTSDLLLLSSITFMSIFVLCFVFLKSVRPNSGNNRVLGIVLGFVAIYTVFYIMGNISYIEGDSFIITNVMYIIISLLSYFGTAYLVENKLEIYN